MGNLKQLLKITSCSINLSNQELDMKDNIIFQIRKTANNENAIDKIYWECRYQNFGKKTLIVIFSS